VSIEQFENIILNNIFLCYGFIPLFAMLLSAYLQLGSDTISFDLRPSAACDIFAFTLALDASLIVSKSTMIQRISSVLAANYDNILVVFLLVSFFLMIFSARTQREINKKTRQKTYPVGSVAICWLFGVGFIGAHIYLLIGK
jgi:hypothetical protein